MPHRPQVLPDKLDSNARVAIRKNSAASTSDVVRRTVNLIEGSNITVTIADDPVNEKVDVTLTGTGGTNYWTFDGQQLKVNTATTGGMTEIYLRTETGSGANRTNIDIFDDGNNLTTSCFMVIKTRSNTVAGSREDNITVVTGDWNQTCNRDWNDTVTRDVNMSAGRDVNIASGSGAGTGDINLTADSGGKLLYVNAHICPVGQAAATGPVGNVVAKFPIYNTSNVLVGYVPVYDAIT